MEKQNLKNTEVNLIYGVDDDLDLPKNTAWKKIAIFTAALFLIFAVCWS